MKLSDIIWWRQKPDPTRLIRERKKRNRAKALRRQQRTSRRRNR